MKHRTWVWPLILLSTAACGGDPDTVPPEPTISCVPNVTQICWGANGCEGAQACNAEGNGFDPCDCGTAGAGG
jgi:hypothetical protein